MDYNFSDRLKNLEGNAIRDIFKLLSRPGIISFAGGIPAPSAIPKEEIMEIINQLLMSDEGTKLLLYGATEGYLPFLTEGIEYLKRVGINDINLNQILAISGGQQGIDLMCKAFLNKGDVVLVEKPTYLAVLHILQTYEAKVVGVESGENGIDLFDLENKIKSYKPKMLYLVPTFSNPTGKTLDTSAREKIATLTYDNQVIVIEDNPYGELRYEGTPINAIKSFDKGGNIVYVTSFSKTISPGMRVGLAVGSKEIIRKLTIGKQATDVHTALVNQAAVGEFLKRGLLDPTLKKHIPYYKKNMDTMLGAIKQYFPKQAKYTTPEGGLFIWVELPAHMDTTKMFKKAVERGVAYVPGTSFFADGSGQNTLRLNFSNASAENIEKGIKILGDLIKEEM